MKMARIKRITFGSNIKESVSLRGEEFEAVKVWETLKCDPKMLKDFANMSL